MNNFEYFEEPLQDNYLVQESLKYLYKYDLDFLITQAKQKNHFSYEILVGVVDFLIDTKDQNDLLEYHHIVFTTEIAKKQINGSLSNWKSPGLRQHYLNEILFKMDSFAKEKFIVEIDLEQKRLLKKEKQNNDFLSLEDFEKSISEED